MVLRLGDRRSVLLGLEGCRPAGTVSRWRRTTACVLGAEGCGGRAMSNRQRETTVKVVVGLCGAGSAEAAVPPPWWVWMGEVWTEPV